MLFHVTWQSRGAETLLQRKITELTLDAFIQCQRKGWMRAEAIPTDPMSEYPEFAQSLVADYKSKAHAFLTKTVAGKLICSSGGSNDSLQEGFSLILDARLEVSDYTLESASLHKADRESLLGVFQYEPVTFHPSDSVTEHTKTLLAFHGLVVGELQGAQPEFGSIICGSSFRRTRIRLKPHFDRLLKTLEALRNTLSEENEPTVPLNSHCDVCEFSARCQKAAVESDHLSLLKGISEKQISRNNNKGIFTVHQLSFTFRSRRRSKRAKPSPPPHSYALQALAHRESKLYIHGSVEIPDAPTVVYFDFEGIPDRRFCYLFGALVCRGESTEYLPFWADSEAEEILAFQSFVESLPLSENLHLFHFGDYETKAIRRLKAKVSPAIAEKITRIQNDAINVVGLLYHHFYFPVLHNSLKNIAEAIGFAWKEPGSNGLDSIIWRHAWERNRDSMTKQRLLDYNLDDCDALRRVTKFLRESLNLVKQRRGDSQTAIDVESTDSLRSTNAQSHVFGTFNSPMDELNEINKCAYFDYQQDKVFARAKKTRNGPRRSHPSKRCRPRVNKTVEILATRCDCCGSRKMSERNSIRRRVIDLRFGESSVRRWIVDYRSFRYICKRCDASFIPDAVPDNKTKYGHGVASWCVYNHLVGGQNMLRIRQVLLDAFGLDIPHTAVWRFKKGVRELVEPFRVATWQELLNSPVLYIDETEVKLRGTKGYVWVFAGPERVSYMFRQTREAAFLAEVLADFQGVVVSDFFTGYDSLALPQQKCLVHLIRDMNMDLRTSPFNDELRRLVQQFACWLRDVTRTIDRFGLKSRHLSKHKEVGRVMLENIRVQTYSSEAGQKYQNRFAKYGDRLMTFTEHDDVSWNNNPAEHAIKAFARIRRFADGRFSEASVSELLDLLSVVQTLELQDRDVLSFLRALRPPATQNAQSKTNMTDGFGSLPEEQIIVKRIRQMRRSDDGGNRMTFEQIAEKLNNEGVSTRRGGRWWGTTVRNVLRRNTRR